MLQPVFDSYTQFGPSVPVYRVSRQGAPSIHRFYDTSPISPSGRYLAYTEFDFDDRTPTAGDEASVVVVDLETGDEVFRDRTAAWDTQLGAQVQWGSDDTSLFFNRMDTTSWQVFGVSLNIFSSKESRLHGPVYMISPDGRHSASPNLIRIGLVQKGYGVIAPKELVRASHGAPEDDGLFVTDTASGRTKLLVSLAEIYRSFPSHFGGLDMSSGGFYGFHAKWSPDGRRIMFIVRWLDHNSRKQSRNWIVTMKADGTDLRIALSAERWRGGHHPNWCPDSEHIIMNLEFANRPLKFPGLSRLMGRVRRKMGIKDSKPAFSLRFATFLWDGSELKMTTNSPIGSGHPTWSDRYRAILTDAYPWEPVAAGDGTSPIRLTSVSDGYTTDIIRVHTKPRHTGPDREWRVDPHPAWDRNGDRFVFNAYVDGYRGVYVAEMGNFALTAEEAAR